MSRRPPRMRSPVPLMSTRRPAGHLALKLRGRPDVVGDHLRRKRLLRRVTLVVREPAGGELEHVGSCGLLDEVGSSGRDVQSRIDTGFLANRLRRCRG